MTGSASERLGNSEVEAVRLLLDRLGLTAEELLKGASPKKEVPTFDEYIPHVSLAVAAGTRRVYGTYWRRVGEVWGKRRIDEPSPMEIKQFAETMKKTVVIRRNSRGGRTAAEHFISAMRCLYAYAVTDGLISAATNPAARVPKPRRLASTRRALSEAQLRSINEVASSTGNDPQLDALLLRLHEETACRRGGALALTRSDVDVEQCLVQLHEKGETVRWQPVSPTLARSLVEHYDDRATSGFNRQVLRYQSGAPVTRRRYDYLWNRLGKNLSWVATQQVSTHWLRHTTLTWVERNFGYGIARAYAGHDSRSAAGTTSTYVKADVYEVARALSALTGEDHPMVAGLPGSLSAGDGVRALPAIPLRIAEG
ncbi:tyrosine-type recombinase/integrase [Micromonospora saelicesensis]|uniref:Phage integrase family protein n=1 Tax=Micromonospora saelicesensis TaxID=285676 RepID=A0A1C4Z416_9ACTN|nr:site-specific integrase [Micromonospora saelicesensis]SCF27351.1 Phage integrase family protein [Micromonospora saelicesensis]